MESWDATIQFEIGDRERFFVQVKDGKIAFFDGKSENPDVTIKSDPEYFTKILLGEMDPQEAYTFHRYEVSGSIVDGTKFKRLGEIVANSHKKALSLVRFFLR